MYEAAPALLGGFRVERFGRVASVHTSYAEAVAAADRYNRLQAAKRIKTRFCHGFGLATAADVQELLDAAADRWATTGESRRDALRQTIREHVGIRS